MTKMQRRKIGRVVITNDDEEIFSASIWGNVWSYDSKIWFGLFFNCYNINLISYFRKKLVALGFKYKVIKTQYSHYLKFQITGTQKIFDNYIDYIDNQIINIDRHTSNGLETYKLKIEIDKKSDYIYNEKVVNAL